MSLVAPVRLAELAGCDRAAFIERVGGAFEASPWVAEAAWDEGPFESLAELHAAMVRAVERAPRERRLALIRAHPELAGAELRLGTLSPESGAEQAGAGLDRLAPEQTARLERSTTAYRERFGFPFVVCVREHTPDSIVEAAEARLTRAQAEEERAALDEIAKIAELRLRDSVDEEEHS